MTKTSKLQKEFTKSIDLTDGMFRNPEVFKGMPISVTFLDEVSWDVPHQNWGVEMWDKNFAAIKAIGINTVVMIRSGLRQWIASQFENQLRTEDVRYPLMDLTKMFLTIKWEKLLYKLEAAKRTEMEDAITFEFSHFMNPNSTCLQAAGLYERYYNHFKDQLSF